jgi:hypothetical protein
MNEKGKKKVVKSFEELATLLQDVIKDVSNEQGKN